MVNVELRMEEMGKWFYIFNSSFYILQPIVHENYGLTKIIGQKRS